MSVLKGEAYFEDGDFPFHIHRCPIKQDGVVPVHAHEFVEFVYVLKGGAMHDMPERRSVLATGDVFVIEPQTYHGYVGAGREDSVVYNLLFDKRLLRKELDVLLQIPAFIDYFYLAPFLRKNAAFVPYLSLNVHQQQLMEALLRKMHDEWAGKRAGYRLVIKTALIECLVQLSRFHEDNGNKAGVPLLQEEGMDSILHFIGQHYVRPLTLAQLSQSCGMSVSSFTAKFKKATGMTFIDYKHSLQIRHACRLLQDPRTKVVHAAYDSGFQDISFFNRVFRKQMGMTPGQFRRSLTRDNKGAEAPTEP
ncbi:AraC family transcriptional regulator [Paenibacillus arenilitoris]|uniref:Helix-turn-helix transcriptional regulator n=1 Tax=Paenibacillus arenilitoris TaxID=2772299 RepID=A0A927CFM9_9BACL|nr:AraC family transcriptional regulator [Paenibacillus arenilitoris]MBD2867209.1 helix-turn-helix transcriptional regulator [Paenibacillus arenilitoris]